MKLLKLNLSILFLLIIVSNHAQTNDESGFAIGLSTGYNNGFGLQLHGTALQPYSLYKVYQFNYVLVLVTPN